MQNDYFIDEREYAPPFSTQDNLSYYMGCHKDRLDNVFFHSQYEQHRQDYLDNFEKYGGTPLKGMNDGCMIPHMVANDDDDYYARRANGMY